MGFLNAGNQNLYFILRIFNLALRRSVILLYKCNIIVIITSCVRKSTDFYTICNTDFSPGDY